MKTSQAGVNLIKKFEGCRLEAYKLAGEKYYTIAYGHYGADVTENMVITHAQAEAMLIADLKKYEGYVEKYATIPLKQNQFDALVSYTYNRGPGGMKELAAHCHTVEEYSAGIVKYWGSATRYKNALLKRRRAERELFDMSAPKSIRDVAREVADGLWGNGENRKKRLARAGYNWCEVQDEVNKIVKEEQPKS